jgi:hypothetical protein
MQQDLFDRIANYFKEKRSASLSERRVLLLCMSLSLLVWFFVKMSQHYESRSVLRLEYQLPMGRVFAEQPLNSMPFKFDGTGWKLLKMGILRQKPGLVFNLSGASTQFISRSDISKKIEEELRLNLLELGQDNVAINLDSLYSKKVKIELDSAISFENGYFFRENISLMPDSVVVFGAPQLLEKITTIKTEPLKMECPEKDFTKSLRIINPQPGLLQLSASQAEVFMPVEQYTEKALTVPVMVLNERDSVRLLPGSVELQCVVGISRYKELKPSDFRVVAVIGYEDATNTVPLTLVRQPVWVKSARISPQAVEYLIVQ